MPTKFVIKLNKQNALVTDVDGTEVIDWVPALMAAASEVEMLNTLAGTPAFPRPFNYNKTAAHWEDAHTDIIPEAIVPTCTGVVDVTINVLENLILPGHQIWEDIVVPEHTVDVPAGYVGSIEGFLGEANTYPTADGMCTVFISNYEWLDLGFLPTGVTPQTFSFILGEPSHVGKLI